jgi:hypothetical protein
MECAPTSSTSSVSPYFSLNPENEEIRLATLAPGSYDDALVIDLGVEILSKTPFPEYEALSYTWGKDVSPQKVTVNGKPLSITANLDCALRHLRYEDRCRVLWVDALCINQADVSERNHQVQLMRQVYSGADTVVIWLGPADGDDDARAIHNIRMQEKDWDIEAFGALARICNRPWFHRVWIVQELKLARSDPKIYLGRNTISWRAFYKFIQAADKATMSLQVVSEHTPPDELRFEVANATHHIASLGDLRENNEDFVQFVDYLIYTNECDATDPRDKVYGILGLVGKSVSRPWTIPDYRKSPQEVFTETVFFLIQNDPVALYGQFPLHPMRAARGTTLPNVSGLPSWCMDLTIDSRKVATNLSFYNRPIRMVPSDVWRWTSGPRRRGVGTIARLSANNTLHTVGVHVATILQTSGNLTVQRGDESQEPGSIPFSDNILAQIYDAMLTWGNIPTSSLLRSLHDHPDEPGLNVQDSPTLFKHSSKTKTKTNPKTEPETANSEMPPSRSEMLRRIVRSAHNMILFTTEEGRIGMSYHPDANQGILPGDVVVGLFSINFPFILRRTSKESEEYRMINVAYLSDHKFIHTSVTRAPLGSTADDVWNDLGKFGLREYVIV